MSLTPWKKLGEPEVLAEGFSKQFIRQKFKDHNGKETNFYFQNQPAWSIVLPITKDNQVILVKEYKQGANAIFEEIPGGTADFKGEDPEVVMEKELLEETGYKPGKVISLGSGWINSRNSTTNYYCFLALDCVKIQEPHPDRSEQFEHLTRPLKEWIKIMIAGEWVQWDAYVTLIRALPHLGIELKLDHLKNDNTIASR